MGSPVSTRSSRSARAPGATAPDPLLTLRRPWAGTSGHRSSEGLRCGTMISRDHRARSPLRTPAPAAPAPAVTAPAARAREVAARLVLQVRSTADLSLLVAAARTPGWQVDDTLVAHLDGEELPAPARPREVPAGSRGERMHVMTGVPVGRLVLEYRGRVSPVDGADTAGATGDGTSGADPDDASSAVERFELCRPSRYCPSDELVAFAASEFGTRADHSDAALAAAVDSWVADRLVYTSGSSTPFDGAVQTMLRGQGVCRDYAHLVVALARALELPARLAAVYAPGLSPMDFHAVAEVRVQEEDGRSTWQVHDATRLSSRPALARISTGRDAADTAFLTSMRGGIVLDQLSVTAVVAGDLPADDGGRVALA